MRAIKKFLRFILKIFLLGAFGVGVYCVLFGLNGIYGGGNSLESNVRKIASSVSNYIPVISNGQLISDEDSNLLQDTGVTGATYEFSDEFYPYYSMLDEKSKEIYKKTYANALEYNSSFLVTNGASIDEARSAVEALFNDHPEIFWIETQYSYLYTEKNICVQIKLNYSLGSEEIPSARARFEAAAQLIINEAAALSSDYEKEKFVHDSIIKSTDYDVEAEMSQSAYSVLVSGKSVCAGYSRAFQYIMQRLEIPTYYVIGYSDGNHAWNIVKLDDGYYNVDVTWDSSWPISYTYFNRTDSDFAETHTREDSSCYLPQCTATAYRDLEHSFGQGLLSSFDKPSPREEQLPQPDTQEPNGIPWGGFFPDRNHGNHSGEFGGAATPDGVIIIN